MSNEIQIRSTLQVRNDTTGQQYLSQPTAFNADQTTPGGPTPGYVLVSKAGTDINLSQITSPGGWCRIQNLDPTNFVEIGVWDPVFGIHLILCELLPGEFFNLRLSRYLGQQFGTGSGSATSNPGATLRIKATVAACGVLIEAFNA